MKKIKILYVEDDLEAAEYLLDFFSNFGFEMTHTDSVTMALSYSKNKKFDLVLLDLTIPDGDGFEILQALKKLHLPVIVISGMSDTPTKIKAFRYGASDYVVKPIDLFELEARIWVHLSKAGVEKNKEGDEGVFSIKDDTLYMKKDIVDLTPTEFDIFKILLKNKNKTVSREQLTNALSSLTTHRTLDYHIKNIRKKIEADSKNPKYLKTEYGVGYKLVDHKDNG